MTWDQFYGLIVVATCAITAFRAGAAVQFAALSLFASWLFSNVMFVNTRPLWNWQFYDRGVFDIMTANFLLECVLLAMLAFFLRAEAHGRLLRHLAVISVAAMLWDVLWRCWMPQDPAIYYAYYAVNNLAFAGQCGLVAFWPKTIVPLRAGA